MKIEFLTQNDPLYILPFFEEFIPRFSGEFQITQITCCRPMGKRSRGQLINELRLLYGASGVLRLLASVASSKVLGAFPRGKGSLRYYSMRQLSHAYGIPWASSDNLNSLDFINQVKKRGSDLLVSVACPYVLKKPLLDATPLGCINIHHAPLPRYKGMMPTFWQMYHGETRVGVSIHYMAEKIDEGPVLFQDGMDILPGEPLHELIRRSKRHGAVCMAEVLRQVQTSSQTTLTLDKSQESYFTFPTGQQIREFKRRGMRAI